MTPRNALRALALAAAGLWSCGAGADAAATINCARASSGTYAAYPTQAERDAWLAARGCPPPVVSSGGQR